MLNKMQKLTEGDDQVLRVLALSWLSAEHIPQNAGQRRYLIQSVIEQYETGQRQVSEALSSKSHEEAIALLGIWKTHLGSSRDTCDALGKSIWDRIEKLEQADGSKPF